jgi:hypothetical protein
LKPGASKPSEPLKEFIALWQVERLRRLDASISERGVLGRAHTLDRHMAIHKGTHALTEGRHSRDLQRFLLGENVEDTAKGNPEGHIVTFIPQKPKQSVGILRRDQRR